MNRNSNRRPSIIDQFYNYMYRIDSSDEEEEEEYESEDRTIYKYCLMCYNEFDELNLYVCSNCNTADSLHHGS